MAQPFTLTVLEIPDIQRGAGLAIVMQTPSGKTFLYDTGTAHPEKLSSDGWLANLNAGHGIHPVPPVFASATHPEFSIASVFPRYDRGLRSAADLQAVGAKICITGLNGNVQVVSDGKGYQVTLDREIKR